MEVKSCWNEKLSRQWGTGGEGSRGRTFTATFTFHPRSIQEPVKLFGTHTLAHPRTGCPILLKVDFALPAVPALGAEPWCREWLGGEPDVTHSRQFSPPVLGRFSHWVHCFSDLQLLEVALKDSSR